MSRQRPSSVPLPSRRRLRGLLLCLWAGCVLAAPAANSSGVDGYRWEVTVTADASTGFSQDEVDALDLTYIPPPGIEYRVPLPGFDGWRCVVSPEESPHSFMQHHQPDLITPQRRLRCSPRGEHVTHVTAGAHGPFRSPVWLGHESLPGSARLALTSGGRSLTVDLSWVAKRQRETGWETARAWLAEQWENHLIHALDQAELAESCGVHLEGHTSKTGVGSFSVMLTVTPHPKAFPTASIVAMSLPGGSITGPVVDCTRQLLQAKTHPFPGATPRVVKLDFVASTATPPKPHAGGNLTKVRGKIGSRIGKARGTGRVDGSAVSKVFSRRKKAIKVCYEKQLKKDPSLKGKVVIKFTIGPGGRVLMISVEKNSTGSAAVGTCIANKVRSWKFPQPTGGSVTFQNQFVLSSG